MSFRRFEHFSIGFGQSPPELGDLEEKGARRDQELPRNEYCRRLVAFRPSRGSPVELPWNENRRHFDAVWSRGMTRNDERDPSRGLPVELPWNENRRHSVAYLPRGMTRTPSLGRRWIDHQMKMTVIWRHIGLVD